MRRFSVDNFRQKPMYPMIANNWQGVSDLTVEYLVDCCYVLHTDAHKLRGESASIQMTIDRASLNRNWCRMCRHRAVTCTNEQAAARLKPSPICCLCICMRVIRLLMASVYMTSVIIFFATDIELLEIVVEHKKSYYFSIGLSKGSLYRFRVCQCF